MKLKNLIYEIFDNPYSTEPADKVTTDAVLNTIAKHKNDDENIGNVKVHKLEGNNGHLITYTRNKSFEIHHINANNESGEMIHIKDTNPRFISTILHHIKTNALDKDRSAKIVSPKDSTLSNHYERIINKLSKKHGFKYEKGSENTLGKDRDVFTIHPKHYTKLNEDGFI